MCKLKLWVKDCQSARCGKPFREAELNMCQQGIDLIGIPDRTKPPSDEASARSLRGLGHKVDEEWAKTVPLRCTYCTAPKKSKPTGLSG